MVKILTQKLKSSQNVLTLHNQLQEFTHELDFAQKVVKSFIPSTTQLVVLYNLVMGVVICALAQSAFVQFVQSNDFKW